MIVYLLGIMEPRVFNPIRYVLITGLPIKHRAYNRQQNMEAYYLQCFNIEGFVRVWLY